MPLERYCSVYYLAAPAFKSTLNIHQPFNSMLFTSEIILYQIFIAFPNTTSQVEYCSLHSCYAASTIMKVMEHFNKLITSVFKSKIFFWCYVTRLFS